jgi:hypothetical protein
MSTDPTSPLPFEVASPPLKRALAARSYTEATPVQEAVLGPAAPRASAARLLDLQVIRTTAAPRGNGLPPGARPLSPAIGAACL